MLLRIARRQTAADRVFPPLDEQIYSLPEDAPGLTPDQRAARSLLALSRWPMSRAARLGRRLAPGESVVRLLWLHRQLFEAELRGFRERAEFWREHWRKQWRNTPASHPDWQAAARRLEQETGTTLLANAGELVSRLVREVFLDALIGLINGNDAGSVLDEAFEGQLRWTRVIDAIDDAALTEAERDDLNSQPLQARIRHALEQGSTDDACALAQFACRQHPALPERQRLLRRVYLEAIRRERGTGNQSKAVQLARDFAELSADEASLRLHRSLASEALADLWGRGMWAAAIPPARQLARLEPDALADARVVALSLRAIAACLPVREWDDAVNHAEALIELQPDEPRWQALRVALRREAIAAHQGAGQWKAAYGQARFLSRDVPDEPAYRDAQAFLGEMMLQECRANENAAEAVSLAKQLEREFPNRPRFRTLFETVCSEGVERLKAEGRLGKALDLAEELAELDRHCIPLQEQAVGMRLAVAVRELSEVRGGDDSAAARRRAEVLRRHLEALNGLCGASPHCPGVYEALGLLHHYQAVQLANGDCPSQALLAAARALAYKADWLEARESQQKIESNLDGLAGQLRRLLQQLDSLDSFTRSRAMSEMSSDVQHLIHEVRQGTRPRDQFLNSGEPARIQKQLKLARARGFWLRMRLEPPEYGWDRLALALDEATDELMSRKPRNGGELMENWTDIVAKRNDPGLRDIDAMTVAEFFLKKEEEFGEAVAPEMPQGEPSVEELLQSGCEQLPEEACCPPEVSAAIVIDETPEETPHAVPVLKAARSRSGEAVPFEFWLFSRRGLKAKLLAALALLVLMTAGGLVLREQRERGKRDTAYEQLRTAATNLDGDAAKQAISDFRAARPFARQDARLAKLAPLEKDIPQWPALKQRNEAFASLSKAVAAYQPVEAARFAREFLAADAARDPRTPHVETIQRTAVELPLRKVRDEAYTALVTAVRRGDPAEAIRAAERFLNAPGVNISDSRTPQVKEQQALAQFKPRRDLRDAAVADMRAALQKRPIPEKDVLAAAGRFLAAGPAADPLEVRSSRIEEWRRYADNLPRERGRDRAYEQLLEVSRKDDDRGAKLAAEQFLKALPPGDEDGRAAQVRGQLVRASEAPRTRKRDAAYQALVKAMRANPRDVDGAVKAADEFLAQPPAEVLEARTEQVRRMRDYAVETPQRLSRDEAYGKLREAAARQDEKAVEEAAAKFLASLPEAKRESDERERQVEQVRAEAREWPRWRVRNTAWNELQQAREKRDLHAVLLASEKFLESAPLKIADARGREVRVWYAEAFADWIVNQPVEPDADAKSRTERYRKLTAR